MNRKRLTVRIALGALFGSSLSIIVTAVLEITNMVTEPVVYWALGAVGVAISVILFACWARLAGEEEEGQELSEEPPKFEVVFTPEWGQAPEVITADALRIIDGCLDFSMILGASPYRFPGIVRVIAQGQWREVKRLSFASACGKDRAVLTADAKSNHAEGAGL